MLPTQGLCRLLRGRRLIPQCRLINDRRITQCPGDHCCNAGGGAAGGGGSRRLDGGGHRCPAATATGLSRAEQGRSHQSLQDVPPLSLGTHHQRPLTFLRACQLLDDQRPQVGEEEVAEVGGPAPCDAEDGGITPGGCERRIKHRLAACIGGNAASPQGWVKR